MDALALSFNGQNVITDDGRLFVSISSVSAHAENIRCRWIPRPRGRKSIEKMLFIGYMINEYGCCIVDVMRYISQR